MKTILRFFWSFTLLLFIVGQGSAQVCEVVDGQVRYGFELKKLTAQEAQQALATGYVDLWTYACFDKNFVDKGLITLANGKINYWGILSALNTHSYKMIDKNGNDDKSGSIAMFAKPAASQSCPGRPNINQTDITTTGAIGATFIQQCCPTWAYSSSSETSGTFSGPLADYYCTTIEAEGKTWYCLKMYPVRFEYKQAKSFYVTFYSGDAADGTTSNGASTFNFRAKNTTSQLIWPGQACGGDQDWSKTSYWGTIAGGVEIESEPTFALTLASACWGTEASGLFQVSAWNGQDWSGYRSGSLQAYVAGADGTRQAVDRSQVGFTGADLYAVLGTASTQPDFPFTLAPAAYVLPGGAPADSLIWSFEDSRGKTVEVKTKLNVVVPPKTYLGAMDQGGNNISKSLSSNGMDTISVGINDIILGSIACNRSDAQEWGCLETPTSDYYVDMADFVMKALSGGAWVPVAGKHPTYTLPVSKDVAINESRPYFISYTYTGPDGKNQCPATTDTVFIKAIKPLKAPTVSVSTQCGSTIDARASVDADSDPTEWQWVMATVDAADNLDDNYNGEVYGVGNWGFQLTPNTSKSQMVIPNDPNMNVSGDVYPLNVVYHTTASGKDSRFYLTNSANPDADVPENALPGYLFGVNADATTFDFLPSASQGLGDVWGTSDRVVNGKWLFVRCKIDGQWSPWFPASLSGSTSSKPVDFSDFRMGISATPCVGKDVDPDAGCSHTDTAVEVGSNVVLRLYLSGNWKDDMDQTGYKATNFDNAALAIANLDFVVIWQRRAKEGDPWSTFQLYDYGPQRTTDNGSNWFYFESQPVTVTQTMQYRAVFGRYGCFVATSDQRDPADDMYNGDEGNDEAKIGTDSYGHFEDAVWVSVKTDIITGTVEGRTDGGVWSKNPGEICNTGTLDLRLQNNGAGQTLQWQVSDDKTSWTDVSGQTSNTFNDVEAYILAQSTTTDACMYKGCTKYFRVNVTEGNESAQTNVYQVTVYKARKLYIEALADLMNVVPLKALNVGICDGSTIDLAVKNSNAPVNSNFDNVVLESDANEGYPLIEIQEIQSNTLPLSFATIGSKTIPYNENDGYNKETPSGSTWHAYRVVTTNGNNVECEAFSDSVVIKKNPKAIMGTCQGADTCENSSVTLTVKNSQNVSRYDWKIPVKDSKDPSAAVPVTDNHTDTYTNTYSISKADVGSGQLGDLVDVTGWGVFGNASTNKPEDTVMCYAGSVEIEVYTHVCTKPAPVVSPNPICAGEKEITLKWSEAFDNGKHTLQDSSAGGWKDIASSEYTFSVAANQTTFTLKKTLFTAAGGYRFRINEGTTMGTASTLLVVNAIPSAPAISGLADLTVCQGSNATFNPVSTPATAPGGTTYTYEWVKGNGADTATRKHSGLSYTVSTAAATSDAGTYRLHAIATANGCADTTYAKANLTVNPLPAKPAISFATAPSVCVGQPVSIQATVTGALSAPAGTAVYRWTKGGASLAGSTDKYDIASAAASDAGSYQLEVVNVTAAGCRDSARNSVTLTVNPLPSGVNVTMADAQFCSDATLTLSAVATATTGNVTGYRWFKGTDTTSGFMAATTSGSYVPGTADKPSVSSASPVATQKYTVKAIFGANGCEAVATSTSTVTVVKTPDPISISFSPASVTVCEHDAVSVTGTLSPASNNGTYTYTWSPSAPGGSTNADISIADALVSHSGTYTLKVDAEHKDAATSKSCTATKSQAVTLKVNANPVLTSISMSADADKLCTGETLKLTATPSPAPANGVTATYKWYSGKIADTAGKVIAAATGNTYSVTAATGTPVDYSVLVTYASGSCSTSAIQEKTGIVIVEQPAITSVSIAPAASTVCQGGTAPEFTATVDPATASAGTYAYQWKKGGSDIAGATGLTYTPTTEMNAAGTYNYQFVVTATNTASGHSCTDTKNATAALTVNGIPTGMKVNVDPVSICSGETLTLVATASATGATPTNYEWFKGGAATGTPISSGATASTFTKANAAVSDAGDYTVKVTFGTGSCEDSETATVKANVVAQPQPVTVTVSPASQTLCTGDNLSITSTLSPADDGSNGTYTYAWSKGTSSTGSMTLNNVSVSDAGTYTLTVTATSQTAAGQTPAKTCTATGSGSSVITVNEMPVITGVSLTANHADGKYCTGETITLTANGTSPHGTASYIWYHAKAADTAGKAIGGATGKTYSPDNTDIASSGDYTVVIIYTNGTCQDKKTAELSITLEEQPAITSVTVTTPANPVCMGSNVVLTATVDPVTATGAAYSYKWKKNGTDMSGETSSTLSLSNLAATTGDTYTCEVTDANGNCSDTESGSLKLVVTKPADLGNVKLTDNKAGDTCKDKGDHRLSVGGIPSGVTPVYTWTLPAGFTAANPGNASTLTVPADMNNNGTYKVNIHVDATAANPCTADTTIEIDVRFVLCGDENLVPGTEPGQGSQIAFVCQNDATTSLAWVGYTPVDEIAAIEKVSWYKSTSNFTNGVAGGTQIGSDIVISNPTAYSWPLKLTQSQVFGNQAAPAHYYIRAKIERTGGVVAYSTIYRFARVENAPAITDLKVTPADDTICLTGSSTTQTFTASNTALAAPGPVYGTWGVTAKVDGTNGVTYMWKTHNDADFGGSAAATTKVVTINGVVSQAPTSAKAVSSYLYQSGNAERVCKDTSDAATGKVTTTQPPLITSFLDGEGKSAKVICASETTYPALAAVVARGEVEKWEKSSDNGATWVDMTSQVTSSGKTTFQLTASEVVKPAAGAANKVNKYRITVRNGSKCGTVTSEYSLTVVSLPDLASVDVTPSNPEYCQSGQITATPKKADGSTLAGVTYQWQDSTFVTGSKWNDIASATAASKNLTAPDTNFYRCVVTATNASGGISCPVTVVSAPVRVRVSEPSSKGTSAVAPANICESQTAQFTLTGHTGAISKLEISNDATFPAGGNTVVVVPGTTPYEIDPSATDIAALLSTSSRKTTLHVRATIQSGGVCSVVTSDVRSVNVYKPAPKLVISAIDPLCANKTLAANNGYAPAIESSFEEIEWTYAGKTFKGVNLPLSYNDLAPKFEDDTTYTVSATVTNTVLKTVCGPTASAPVTFKVNRKAVAPAKSNDTTICEGSDYVVSAVRPAKSALLWQKDGANLPAGENVSVNGQRESIIVTNAAKGTYVYTVSDKTACNQQDATVTVTVDEQPKAGTISVPAGTNGDFCQDQTVNVTADAGSYVLPAGGQISWQVCTDTTDYAGTRQASLEQSGKATYSKSARDFTAGTQYYVRYGVSGSSTCPTAYSPWIAVKVIAKPSIEGFTVSSGDGQHVCQGTEVTLTVKGKTGLEYEIFSNTTKSATGGTSIQTGTIDATGTVTFAVSPQATTYYYAVLTDPAYQGNAGCGTSDPSSVLTVNVDDKPVGGRLLFTNTDIAGQPTANGKKLEGNVGEHTAQLRLDGSTGTTKVFKGMSDKGTAVNGGNINPTASLPLTTDHMDKTLLWAVVTNGVCPPAYSDTVELTVKIGTEPALTVNSPICKGSSAVMSITVPDAVKDDLVTGSLKLEYQAAGASAWTEVSGATFAQAADKLTVSITEALTATLDTGSYKFRFKYVIGSASEAVSNEQTLHVDAHSIGGNLAATDTVVCQNGTSPVISLKNHLGNITKLEFGKTETAINTSVGGSQDPDKLYEVPTSNLDRSGWYQATVKNGVCPEAKSDKIFVRVVETPLAGTLSVDKVVCYDDGTATVTLSGNRGGSITWKTSSTQAGTYVDVPNTDQTTYVAGPLTDHLYVKVAVTTGTVCPAVESAPLEVKVYDTVKITTQPVDPTSVIDGSAAVLTVAGATGGLTYGDGGSFEANAPGAYQWQLLGTDGTTWSNISDGNDFGGTATASLTIKAANAKNYAGRYFRCVVTDQHCNFTVASQKATIRILTALEPGTTNSLTACECYYSTDEATYFVTGAAGQGDLKFRWEVQRGGSSGWEPLENVFPDLSSVCKGFDSDTIVFFRIGDLYNDQSVRYIRAWVSDAVNTVGMPTAGAAVEVCMVDKPSYTFDGNIVCERTGSGSEVAFGYTAVPDHIDGRSITYAYALPSAPADFKPLGIPSGADVPTVVDLGGGKSITFTVKAADTTLVIPSGSAIPFEADSMVLRMEVRSCYTPAPLSTTTDTTIYAVLRVDKAPDLELLQDTVVCKGSDVKLVASYRLYNTTIPGNKVSVSIAPGGPTQETDAVAPAQKTLDYTISSIQNTATYTATIKTTYCAEKTSQAVVTVKEVPELVSIEADSVCEGGNLNFKAVVTNYDVATCELTWQKYDPDTRTWEDLGNGLDYAKTDVGVTDAGRYRLKMKTLVPSCADSSFTEIAFKVKVVPELYLGPGRCPGPVMVRSEQTTKVDVRSKTVAEMGYDPAYVILAPVTDYEWYVQMPGSNAYEKLDGSNYTDLTNSAINEKEIVFNGVEAYDGMAFYAKAATACGVVSTCQDTLRVTDKFSIVSVTPSPGPICRNDPDAAFTVEVSTSLPPTGWGWQVSTNGGATWNTVTAGPVAGQSPATYELVDPTAPDGREFSLVIHNPTLGMNTWRYRAWATDGTDSDTTTRLEPVISALVTDVPDTTGVRVTITDLGPNNSGLEDGQGRPGDQIELGLSGYKGNPSKVCFYQAFVKDGQVDSVAELPQPNCGTDLTYTLTQSATVAEHDSTLYFARIYNDCGFSDSKINLLRIFDTLSICWIPDTTIENPSGGWDPATNTDPEPGQLVVVLRPGEDSVQVAAHLWVCQAADFLVNDTTRSGFMNRETDDPDLRGSRWLYRTSEDEEWMLISTYEAPWDILFAQGLEWQVAEHKGNFGFPMPQDPDMDGWQFRAVGVNDLYDDSTCILTLHVIPALEKGQLEMKPAQVELCGEGLAQFEVASDAVDLSRLSVDWQVKPADAADWSENIDSLHNDTIYTVGLVGREYDGYQVRAIAQGPCGGDTVEGLIKVNLPKSPAVFLAGDTVCFGDPLLLTAVDTGDAGHLGFNWYVDGRLVAGATGETLDLGDLAPGNYEVTVVMFADTVTNACVAPVTASGSAKVKVNPLPSIEAFIRDTVIKTGFGTEVWASTPDGNGYAWTPEELLESPDSERTATIEFEKAGKYTFVVTTVNEFGCHASDSVVLDVMSNFRLDSIPVVVVTPPILPNGNGTLPGLPGGSYPFGGEGVTEVHAEVFYENEAEVWVCPGNEVRVVIATSGGEKPVNYAWSRVDGTAYPREYNDSSYYAEPDGVPAGWYDEGASTADFTVQDSIIVFFFPDSTTHQLNCHITDAAGSELDVTVHVRYFVPELIYIETRPKTTSTKFYEDQAVYFHARPQRYPDYYWLRLVGEGDQATVTDARALKKTLYSTSFKMENPDETHNQVWVSAIDRHGCRIWDSTGVELMELPNVMIIDDPDRPYGGVIFPEFEVEITNMWGLRIKTFKNRNSNGSSRGWDGRTPSGVKVAAGTYYYKVKIPTLDGFVYMTGAVTVVNR